jgi:ribulose-phosphate 3-epimerase
MSIQQDFKLNLEIIPGILEKDWDAIEQKIEQVKGLAKVIHIDLIDGKFVNNMTLMDPKPFEKFAKDFILEVHMMVQEPLHYVKSFADAGFVRFIGHVEKMQDQVAFIAEAQLWGEALLALDGPTEVDAIKVHYEDLDGVLVYTSERVGFSGPPFNPQRLEKVKKIREKAPWLPIEIDGGVTDQMAEQAKEAGVTRFVSTSFLFASPEENYKKLLTTISLEK